MDIEPGVIGNVIAAVSLIVAAFALMRQRKADERQRQDNAEQGRQKLRLLQHEALILQLQVAARLSSVVYELLMLVEKGDELLRFDMDSVDRSYVDERTSQMKAQLDEYSRLETANERDLGEGGTFLHTRICKLF